MTQNAFGIDWHTVQGPPMAEHGMTLTAHTAILRVRAPYGGFVWRHPRRVTVTHGAATWSVPIVDVTLVAVMILRAMTVAVLLIAAQATMRNKFARRRTNHD